MLIFSIFFFGGVSLGVLSLRPSLEPRQSATRTAGDDHVMARCLFAWCEFIAMDVSI